jgi:hypothetical protein
MQKKRRRTVLIVVCSVLVGCLCCAAAVLYAIFWPSSPRDVPISIGATVTFDNQPKDEQPHEFYPSVDASLAGDSSYEATRSLARTSGELFRFEDDNEAAVYFFGENSSGMPALLAYYFDKHDGKYSELLSISFISRDTSNFMTLSSFAFQPDEEVAFYLFESGPLAPGQRSWATDGKPLFIGVTQNEDIGRLRILGEPPTKVLTCYDEGERYYIWYYLGLDISQALVDDPDFDFGGFTLGRLIDALDIRFEE